jgi:hypothetical protein
MQTGPQRAVQPSAGLRASIDFLIPVRPGQRDPEPRLSVSRLDAILPTCNPSPAREYAPLRRKAPMSYLHRVPLSISSEPVSAGCSGEPFGSGRFPRA